MDRIAEFIALASRLAPVSGVHSTSISRLDLIRAEQTTTDLLAVYEASLCLIIQGAKTVTLGGETLFYDASSYLVVSVDLPILGRIVEASPEAPYLCAKIGLDQKIIAELLIADDAPLPTSEDRALAVYPSDPELIDAALRLVRLLEQPQSIATLAPLIEREILYRLLSSPYGATLRRIAVGENRIGKVSRAVAWIRERYRAPFRVDEVAEAAGMSTSSLHEHFKAVTTMTPLEFQKQLRLHEARRLMLSEGANAGTAGFAVGYESPSQFSREYRRLFGAPPRQDIERLLIAGEFLTTIEPTAASL